MRRGCCHTASARAGSGSSAIRDPGVSVGDSARLALEVRLRHPHCKTPSHMSNNRLTDEGRVWAIPTVVRSP